MRVVILHEKKRDINIYDQLIMVMIKSASMSVLVRFNNCFNIVAPSHISNMDIHSHIFLLRKKRINGFENTFFFHFICVVLKRKIFDVFPPIL